MITKYEVWYSGNSMPQIKKVKCEKESMVSVWKIMYWPDSIPTVHRLLKMTDGEAYFDTWEEVKTHCSKIAIAKFNNAVKDLNRAHEHRDAILSMKKPE